jgi:uncharacterized repeat protein (TIGR01451 family)
MRIHRWPGYSFGLAIAMGVLGASAARADVSINKAFVPSIINPGDTSQLTISLFNSSATSRTGAAFEDSLPSGVSIASPLNFTNGCGGIPTFDSVTQKIKLVNGVIPAQVGTNPGKCNIVVDVVSMSPGNKINNIPVGALTVSNGESNSADANATLSVNTLTSLSGTKSFSPSTVPPNGRSRLKITLSNSNFIPIFSTGYTDNLPTGMTIAPAPNPVFSCNNSGGTGGGQIAAISGATAFTVSSLLIPARVSTTNGSCDLSIDVLGGTTSSTTNYVNSILANTVTTGRGITNTAFSGTLTVDNRAKISKKFATPGAVGTSFLLTISITNGSLFPLTNAAISDSLPTNGGTGVMTIATPANSSITCKDGSGATVTPTVGTVTATPGSNLVQASGLTVPAASAVGFGTCDIKLNVKVNALGVYPNTIPIASFTNTETVVAAAAATANASVSNNGTGGGGPGTTTPVTISKSFAMPSISSNGTSVLTITISNPTGNQDLTGMSLTDNLPPGLTLASTPSVSSTCNYVSTPSFTAAANSSILKITGGSLKSGTSCTINATVTGIIANTYTNTIPAGAMTTTNSITNSNAATADLTVIPGVRITKSFNGNTIAANGISRLRINIENFQGQPLTGATFTDTLTSGVKIAANPQLTNSCGGTLPAVANGTSLVLTNGTIPLAFSSTIPGQCSIEVNVTKTTAGTFTNTILANNFRANIFLQGVTQVVTNPVAAMATLTASTTLGLSVNKVISPNNITGGSTAIMTIRLTNSSGAATLTGVKFTDTMPPGMLVAAQPNLLNSCSGLIAATNPPVGNSTLVLTDGSIPPATTCTISVNITSSVAGNLTNTIPTGGVTSQEGVANVSAAAASITFLPFPGVSKGFTPGTIARGEISRLTVQISNFGTSTLTGASLSDQLPTNLTFATPPTLATTCLNGSASITGDILQLTGATLPPKSACTFSADVTSTIAQSYVNTIPANALSDSAGNTNPEPASATLQVIVPPRPGIYLVKRITAINGQAVTRDGTSLSDYLDIDTNPYDDNNITIPVQIVPTDPPKDTDRWPTISTFMLGGTQGGTVKPGDEVEYTIYFLSAGDQYAKNVSVCDLIPANQFYVPTTYNSAYTAQTGTIGVDRGLLTLNGGLGQILTGIADSDSGRYYPPGTTLPNACKPTPTSPIPPNPNGAVVFNLGDLQVATPIGTTPNPSSYGYVRFRARVQ